MALIKEKPKKTVVELLVNPFCMACRDVDTVHTLCDEHNAGLKVYNLWEIDDADAGKLPPYIAKLIREWRSGKRPGSVYSSAFVNSRRIPFNDWPRHLGKLGRAISRQLKRGGK